MPRRKPTLDERERTVAAREQAIATVMPYITPALKNLTEMLTRVDEQEAERRRKLTDLLIDIGRRANAG